MEKSFIVSERKRTGLTQEQLAKYVGVSVNTVKRWETGKSEPLFVNQKSIRAAFKYSTKPTKTNNWTKQENSRRYFLHRHLKGNFHYSAKGRTIWTTEEQITLSSPLAARAMEELKAKFEYNVQFQIPEHVVGQIVKLNPDKYPMQPRKTTYEILAISGTFADIKPLNGRWRKVLRVFISHTIPV